MWACCASQGIVENTTSYIIGLFTPISTLLIFLISANDRCSITLIQIKLYRQKKTHRIAKLLMVNFYLLLTDSAGSMRSFFDNETQ